MAKDAGGLPIADVPTTDIFADEALGFENMNGTVRISFATVKSIDPAPPSELQFVPIGRLVLPQDSAKRLCVSLYDFLRRQGLDPNDIVGAAPEKPN